MIPLNSIGIGFLFVVGRFLDKTDNATHRVCIMFALRTTVSGGSLGNSMLLCPLFD